MNVLHLDENHPILIERLAALGYENHADYTSSKAEIMERIHQYEGIIIRSRIPIDRAFLEAASRLRFIGRVGAGLENIDTDFARERGIYLAAAPEGNRNAVGEHTLGMLLALLNKLHTADAEVRNGIWQREANRGWELDGRTVGIIGYGNMGKAFARKLRGFDVEVICYDIQGGVGDENARQVGILEFFQKADVVSLHVPQTQQTTGMVDTAFLERFHKPIWILNTARGKCIRTADLAEALQTGKVLGAGLDVLEYEKASFESLFAADSLPEPLQYLIQAPNVLLTPHVAGWTVESKEKLAQTVADKIKAHFS
ncbi:2-hydroxyacid dehydrogenase [Robiginitalea sp. M366]|uniref:2-hydroxyacid dehydrogenase n=1 Tax=Robiginitalea aestuariiviva TaxID=3036903 RepID=UPI00240D6371|nr:2-hydroxyacid dehydrogenase [Robiginitalea aestuariiviva]MDG1571194.1 2-hydroxyacid dehydrogenase [Robiginitalea aestuariiviva]